VAVWALLDSKLNRGSSDYISLKTENQVRPRRSPDPGEAPHAGGLLRSKRLWIKLPHAVLQRVELVYLSVAEREVERRQVIQVADIRGPKD